MEVDEYMELDQYYEEKCLCDTRLEDARCKDCDVAAAASAAERGE